MVVSFFHGILGLWGFSGNLTFLTIQSTASILVKGGGGGAKNVSQTGRAQHAITAGGTQITPPILNHTNFQSFHNTIK